MSLPMQMLSLTDKQKINQETGKTNIEETIDYYISQAKWEKHNNDIQKLYNAVEGVIDISEYRKVQNPFNIVDEEGKMPSYAVKLKNFNIIKGIVNLLLGEFSRRSHDYIVVDLNPLDEISYKEGLDSIINDYYKQMISNQLIDNGVPLGEKQEMPPLEEYVKEFKQKYDSTRVIRGQDALDYIRYNCKLDSLHIDLYYDWLVTGGAYTFKTVINDEVKYERVPTNELFVPFEKHSRFIEDYSFAVRRQVLPIARIVDYFRGKISEELLAELLTRFDYNYSYQDTVIIKEDNTFISSKDPFKGGGNIPGNSLIYSKEEGIELFHVQYISYDKYYILKYIDVDGKEKELEVDNTYKLNKALGDISLTESYKPVLLEGYKVLDYYLNVGEVLTDRSDLNGTNIKLYYNGIRERSFSGEIQSIVKEGIDYQIAINTLFYQMEKTINKAKANLLVLPQGLITGKNGMDRKNTMYHADATAILWIDETASNAALAAQMIKSINMGLDNYIQSCMELARYYKETYWNDIGMNAQRYNDISQGAGKAVTEQAIVRSSIITNELTRQFEMLIECDYTGLLDISKYAWINGKKANYINSDGSKAFLELNIDDVMYHTETAYNVFVRNSAEMTEAITALRQQALPLLQNGAPIQTAGLLYSTNNIEKLTKILTGLEENKKQYDQMIQEQQQQANQALQDSKNENDRLNREVEMYKADKQYQSVVDGAMIKADNSNTGIQDNTPSDLEYQTFDLKKSVEEEKLRQADEKLRLSILANRQKNNNDNRKLDIQEKGLTIKNNNK